MDKRNEESDQHASDDVSLLKRRVTRRKAISTGAGIAAGVAAGLVVGGAAGYLGASSVAPSGATTVTSTQTQTVTNTQTITSTQSASSSASSSASPKKSIVFGFSAPLSGYLANFSSTGIVGPYTLWAEQVNSRGGIYVPEYGTLLPVELKYYDDKSDPQTAITVYERLISEDKVDILLSPYTTTLHVPMLPVIEKHQAPMIGSTTGTEEIVAAQSKYMRAVSPATEAFAAQRIVELLSANKDTIKTVALSYSQLPYPVGVAQQLQQLLPKAGFDVVLTKNYAPDVTDLTPLIADVKAANPDAYLCNAYFVDIFLLLQGVINAGYNPKLMYGLVGFTANAIHEKFGKAVEGVSEMSFWVPGLNAESEYVSRLFYEKYKTPVEVSDFPYDWIECQVWEQAIRAVGLSWDKLHSYLDTATFNTLTGPITWNGQVVDTHAYDKMGVAQWLSGSDASAGFQNQHVEQVWPTAIATAKPIIPKPAWP